MNLESGPASKDRNYWLLVTVIFLGAASYFLYDGTIGYQAQNRADAKTKLAQSVPGFPIEGLDEKLKEEPAKEKYESIRDNPPTDPKELHRALNAEPVYTRVLSDAESTEYFPTLYGLGIAAIKGGVVVAPLPRWQDWKHKKDDIQGQFTFAALFGIVSLYLIMRTFKAATLRAVIDDSGMTYGGNRILFDAMVSLQDYSPKGWVDLYYKANDGNKRRLRIDNQKILKFDEIVNRLCEIKGFEHPIKLHGASHESDEREPTT